MPNPPKQIHEFREFESLSDLDYVPASQSALTGKISVANLRTSLLSGRPLIQGLKYILDIAAGNAASGQLRSPTTLGGIASGGSLSFSTIDANGDDSSELLSEFRSQGILQVNEIEFGNNYATFRILSVSSSTGVTNLTVERINEHGAIADGAAVGVNLFGGSTVSPGFSDVTTDSGTISAVGPEETLSISGAGGIFVEAIAGEVVINGSAIAPVTDTFLTIASDVGSTTANSPTDTLTIEGSGGIATSITGDILTIDGSAVAGAPGVSAIANNSASFTQPAIDAFVTVTVDSSAGLVSQAVYRHSSGNTYRVTAIPSSTSITIRNSNEFQGAGQSAGSANVPAGTFAPSGERGLQGLSLGSLYTVSASAAASAGQINITGSTLTIHTTDGEGGDLSPTILSTLNLPIGSSLELVNQATPTQRQQLRTTTAFTGGSVLTASVSSSGTAITAGALVRVSVRAKGEVGAGGSITVTDGTTSVTGVTNVQFTKASSVTNLGSGVARVNNDGGSVSLQGTSLTRLTVQSIPNDAVTFISFPAPGSDPLSAFNIANPTRLTAPTTGWYLLSGFITLNSNVAITVFSIFFTKNGTNFTPQARVPVPSGGINPGFPITDFQFLTAGDYIELGIYQNSGTSKNTFDSSFLNPTFKMLKIG